MGYIKRLQRVTLQKISYKEGIVQEKLEDIKNIQNTLWGMYKSFLADHSVKEWTRKGEALAHEYDGKEIRTFCENLLFTWTPVINTLAEKFRMETGC